jgi:3-methyladenine DNA glycosylase Tag
VPEENTRTGRLSDAWYLEHLTRKIFVSGFAWEPVNKKWPHFREVFYGFDPEMVADMPEPLVEHISNDKRIIRNRVKIRATVRNAQEFLRIEQEYGSFAGFLRSLDALTYGERAGRIARRFASVGPNTVYYFLRDCGEPVPARKPEGVR